MRHPLKDARLARFSDLAAQARAVETDPAKIEEWTETLDDIAALRLELETEEGSYAAEPESEAPQPPTPLPAVKPLDLSAELWQTGVRMMRLMGGTMTVWEMPS